jgi:Cys-rich repeat protein
MKHLRRATTILGLMLALSLPLIGCSGGNGDKCDGGPCVDADDGDGDSGPKTCTTIADCPSHYLCINGFCSLGDICTKDEDCPDQYICNIIKEVCVPETPCLGDTDCAAPTPYCITGVGICAECREDAHCSMGTPHCSTAGKCLICMQNAHCAAGEICQNNACVLENGCESDADCDTGKHCDLHDHKCYTCVTDAHCAGAYVCVPDLHRCEACYLDQHCVSGDHCWTGNFTCVECLDDSHCPTGTHCNLSSHSCTAVVCTSDNDCVNEPMRPKCHIPTGDCVQCVAHADCGTYQWCRDFSCQSGCQTDLECEEKLGQNYRCDVPNGACFYAECMDDPDCAGNQQGKLHCKIAATPSNPPQYTCVECTADEHCDEYFECNPTNFTCRKMACYKYPDPDTTCHQIDPCYFCDFGSGDCEPAHDCPIGNECCQGYTCNTFSHCERNLDCNSNADCPTDSECNTVTKQCEYLSCCEPPCSQGQFCNGNCQCESGCHDQGEECDPMNNNCCENLRCPLFWPFCTP